MITKKEEWQYMISDCLKRRIKLNEWECLFVENLNKQVKALTEKQLAKLEKIWDRITEK